MKKVQSFLGIFFLPNQCGRRIFSSRQPHILKVNCFLIFLNGNSLSLSLNFYLHVQFSSVAGSKYDLQITCSRFNQSTRDHTLLKDNNFVSVCVCVFFFFFPWCWLHLLYTVPKKKKCALFNVEYFENWPTFLCKFGIVSHKYTIHRSNIKLIPCWAENFAIYGNT